MNWRNPEVEMPRQGQLVFTMMDPHKWRGTLFTSASSIEIRAGQAFFYAGICRIETFDEYGTGLEAWYLGKLPEDFLDREAHGIAWIPVEEMSFPNWYRG